MSLQIRRIAIILLLASASSVAQISVVTNRFDNGRTGWNPGETSLNTANVVSATFGKLYSYEVDGSVYAQPLYVPNVSIPGKGIHNVLYVVTMYDSVYAFDADQNVTLWHTSFIHPDQNITPVPIADITGSNSLNIVGWVGIESTPVINPSSGTIYVVARTKEVSGPTTTYVQRLHALDIRTGVEKLGGPVTIAGSVPGTGEQSSGGVISFDPFWENQRPGLALTRGQVIITWASHEDDQPYHGWVMAYSASTLAQTGIFNVTPNGIEGGIWMSGRAPVIDSAGNIYILTGNGTSDGNSDYGESMIRLSATGGLVLQDYFTASNAGSLNSGDTDLGASGPLLIPKANLLIGGGKQGVLYLLDPNNLGHTVPNDTQIPQKFQAVNNLIFPGPSYWESASKGQLLYIWVMGDFLKAFHFNGTTFDTAPLIQSTQKTPNGYNPGGTLTISSSGTDDSTGIVWASMPVNGDEWHGLTAGMLRAMNAVTGEEIWNSQALASRDAVGASLAKFVSPTVVNGKVYMGTFTDYTYPALVSVYGLITASPKFGITASPSSTSTVPGNPATFTVSVTPLAGHSFTGTVKLSVSGLPVGSTASFSPGSIKGTGSATLTIATTAATPLGTSILSITGAGSASGYSSVATVSLTVIDKVRALSVDFVGLAGSSLAASDVAGVVAKSHWNNITGFSSSLPIGLLDENGVGTGVAMTFAGDNTWSIPIAGASPNAVMMQGYLDDSTAGPSIVTLTGLPVTAAGYSVYLYADGDNPSVRSATYTLTPSGGTAQSIVIADAAGVNFSGTFQLATPSNQTGNYGLITIPGGDFTLTATPLVGNRAPLNGLQIIPN